MIWNELHACDSFDNIEWSMNVGCFFVFLKMFRIRCHLSSCACFSLSFRLHCEVVWGQSFEDHDHVDFGPLGHHGHVDHGLRAWRWCLWAWSGGCSSSGFARKVTQAEPAERMGGGPAGILGSLWREHSVSMVYVCWSCRVSWAQA